MPSIQDAHEKERVTDELPQSGSGRTIMTTQPKFVPNEAVSIQLDGKIELRIRMVDCVGYLVEGAMGHTENDEPRMVRTPWFDYDIPFEQAAEIGTQRVIQDHSAIGVVVTTDGTISDIPRENYVKSEERVVRELQELGKPFCHRPEFPGPILRLRQRPGGHAAKQVQDCGSAGGCDALF